MVKLLKSKNNCSKKFSSEVLYVHYTYIRFLVTCLYVGSFSAIREGIASILGSRQIQGEKRLFFPLPLLDSWSVLADCRWRALGQLMIEGEHSGRTEVPAVLRCAHVHVCILMHLYRKIQFGE